MVAGWYLSAANVYNSPEKSQNWILNVLLSSNIIGQFSYLTAGCVVYVSLYLSNTQNK